MKEIRCPSGAVLKIGHTPFGTSKALYHAFLKELRSIPMNSKTDMAAVYKDVFCSAMASLEFDRCLSECMKRCTYDSGKGDLKIDGDTFEPIHTREDYTAVCLEVAQENLRPFLKSLLSEFAPILAAMQEDQT